MARSRSTTRIVAGARRRVPQCRDGAPCARFNRNPPERLLTGVACACAARAATGCWCRHGRRRVPPRSDGSSLAPGCPPGVRPIRRRCAGSPNTLGRSRWSSCSTSGSPCSRMPASAQSVTFTDVRILSENSFGQTWLEGASSGGHHPATSTSCSYNVGLSPSSGDQRGLISRSSPAFRFPRPARAVGGARHRRRRQHRESLARLDQRSLLAAGRRAEMGHNFGLNHSRSRTAIRAAASSTNMA